MCVTLSVILLLATSFALANPTFLQHAQKEVQVSAQSSYSTNNAKFLNISKGLNGDFAFLRGITDYSFGPRVFNNYIAWRSSTDSLDTSFYFAAPQSSNSDDIKTTYFPGVTGFRLGGCCQGESTSQGFVTESLDYTTGTCKVTCSALLVYNMQTQSNFVAPVTWDYNGTDFPFIAPGEGLPASVGAMVAAVMIYPFVPASAVHSVFDKRIFTFGNGMWNQFSPTDDKTIVTDCTIPSGGSYVNGTATVQNTVPSDVVIGSPTLFAYAKTTNIIDLPQTVSTCSPVYKAGGTVDIMLSNGIVARSFPYPCSLCFGGVAAFWNNILVYKVSDNTSGLYSLWTYDTRSGSNFPLNPQPVGSAVSDRTIASDGNDLIWDGFDNVTNQWSVYVYSSSGVIKLPESSYADSRSFYPDPQVSGDWAFWINQTNCLNFYNIQRHALTGANASQSDSSAIATGRAAEWDFENNRAIWITSGFAPENASLNIYDLNKFSNGQQPYSSINLNLLGAGGTPGDILASPDWIFFSGTPTGSTNSQILAAKPGTHIPIIVIPGIAATTLYSDRGGGQPPKQVWLGGLVPQYASGIMMRASASILCNGWNALEAFTSTNCGERLDLMQNATGGSLQGIKVGRILDFNLPIFTFGHRHDSNAYGALEKDLISLGYSNNTDFFLFPYDWRLDNAVHFSDLDNLISKVQNITGSYSVIIICHSMGGLVARGFVLSNPIRASKVYKIISIDTPYWGATKGYYAVLDGYNFGNPSLDQVTAKIMAQNALAAYELMPRIPFIVNQSLYGAQNALLVTSVADMCKYSPAACVPLHSAYYDVSYPGFAVTTTNGVTSPLLPGQDPRTLGSISRIDPSSANLWTLNSGLLDSASTFWKPFGNYTNPSPSPVPTYALIGDGLSTLDGYVIPVQSPSVIGSYFINGTRTSVIPRFSDGDATVPIWSEQLLANNTYLFYFRSGSSSTEHVQMAGNPNALQVVNEILGGSVPTSQLCQSGKLCSNQYGAGSLFQNEERQTTDFTLHSNADLSVVNLNDTSQRLGLNGFGGIDETINGSSFLIVGGAEYASITGNSSDTYRVFVNGTGNGEFSLSIDTLGQKSGNVSFYFNNVPVTNSSTASVTFNPSRLTASSLPSLSLSTGNGETLFVQPSSPFVNSSKSSTIANLVSSSTSLSESPNSTNVATLPSRFPIEYLIVGFIAVVVVITVGFFFVRRIKK
ncbi:MAG: hypothetical protein OK457_01815 [Thaumarchaeota archaeon]|nr:hypothetical protein [Nitrososphaerota archaeon]